MMTPLLSIGESERIAERIQKSGEKVTCRLMGDIVSVTALPANAFQIDGLRTREPKELRSYKRLNENGADVPVIEDGGMPYFSAIVTWDTMVHHLVRTRDLKIK